MKNIHQIIRNLRKEHGIMQNEIANYLGISQQTYSNYENGQREIPVWAVVAISQYYRISTDYLLGADTSYLGSVDLNNEYVNGITMHDVLYEIQRLEQNKREDLMKYIRYLNHIGHSG